MAKESKEENSPKERTGFLISELGRLSERHA